VAFTASRRVMGPLVNRRLTTIAALAVTTVIVALNVYLLTTF
jgi:manganese transport protein